MESTASLCSQIREAPQREREPRLRVHPEYPGPSPGEAPWSKGCGAAEGQRQPEAQAPAQASNTQRSCWPKPHQTLSPAQPVRVHSLTAVYCQALATDSSPCLHPPPPTSTSLPPELQWMTGSGSAASIYISIYLGIGSSPLL